MKQYSRIQIGLSYFLKAIVILSALIGTFLSWYAGRNSFMGDITVFMYFTIQSNLALALISIIGFAKLFRQSKNGDVWYIIQFVGAVSISLTGSVFCFVLAPTIKQVHGHCRISLRM